MAKLTLAEEPTFEAPVKIPLPGKEPESIKFIFKHRTRDELQAHIKDLEARKSQVNDVELVMSVAEGWELADEFNQKNVARLLQKFHAAANAISTTYINELTQARLGN